MSSAYSEEYAAELVRAPATVTAFPFVNDGTLGGRTSLIVDLRI